MAHKGQKNKIEEKKEYSKHTKISDNTIKKAVIKPKQKIEISEPKLRRTNQNTVIDVTKIEKLQKEEKKEEIEIKGIELEGNEEDYTEEDINKIILEKLKKAKQNKNGDNKKKTIILPDELDKNVDSRKKTEEGWPIYTTEELKLGLPGSGNTPLCPFDCDCCF